MGNPVSEERLQALVAESGTTGYSTGGPEERTTIALASIAYDLRRIAGSASEANKKLEEIGKKLSGIDHRLKPLDK